MVDPCDAYISKFHRVVFALCERWGGFGEHYTLLSVVDAVLIMCVTIASFLSPLLPFVLAFVSPVCETFGRAGAFSLWFAVVSSSC